ncbi:MAG: fibronectin type III domain-containing protein, partial [Jatrophihabitantaceae bacterium]
PGNPRRTTRVAVRVDRGPAAYATADRPYPGLARSHPLAGWSHGFSVTFPVTEGTHRICLKVFNIMSGSDMTVTCYARWTVSFSPSGAITSIRQTPGGAQIGGYASDPDTTAPTTVTVTADGQSLATVTANGHSVDRAGHGFSAAVNFPGTGLAPGPRTLCVIAQNLGQYGKTRTIQCTAHTFDWNPTGSLDAAVQQGAGALVTGWATDPDTNAPIDIRLWDGATWLGRFTANGATGSHPGHMFSLPLQLTNGKHTICATAMNVSYGAANATPSCKDVTLNFDPYGTYESVARAGSSILVKGWAIDPETTKPITVQVTVGSAAPVTATANVTRSDVAAAHPGTGPAHGFAVSIPASATDGEQRVCVSAVNVGGGNLPTVGLGCRLVFAVHPVAPSAPTGVTAVGGYGGAQLTWTAPTSDGGAPWTKYTIRTLPSGPTTTVASGILSATMYGLKPSTRYTFSVSATNVAGTSKTGVSPAVTTQRQPPPQTSPAPISTSRYVRNVYGSSSTDLAKMRAEGAADARANPSGHGYLVVLAVGGQDESRHGLILTAGIRYVSYAAMVKCLTAYLDGYAGQQRPSAPVVIAISTNNDIDVRRSSGVSFANNVVDPVQSYARHYPGITIAGSDDMEPGFRATYAQTRYWLQGYLSATSAPFVNTGSADGCAWTFTGGHCNNGWTMSGLYYLTAGAFPVRMINMPQIYNTTMAQQWRYISLTGVKQGSPRINFGGALTEWTACRQAHSCGSLTGNAAWTTMWNQLRAEPALRPSTLPYSTDLRIDS